MPKSYKEMIDLLVKYFPEFDLTVGIVNKLVAPAIIVQLADVSVNNADNENFSVSSATYVINFYVASYSTFDVRRAAMLFGNISQVDYDAPADGTLFQATAFIQGGKALWDVNKDG